MGFKILLPVFVLAWALLFHAPSLLADDSPQTISQHQAPPIAKADQPTQNMDTQAQAKRPGHTRVNKLKIKRQGLRRPASPHNTGANSN